MSEHEHRWWWQPTVANDAEGSFIAMVLMKFCADCDEAVCITPADMVWVTETHPGVVKSLNGETWDAYFQEEPVVLGLVSD